MWWLIAILLFASATKSDSTVQLLNKRYQFCNDINLLELTIPKIHDHYHRKSLSPVQLTRCYLLRIKALNPYLNAVIEINPEALHIAKKLQSNYTPEYLANNPLFGIPTLIKDNIATDNLMETTAGTFALMGVKPNIDADVVMRLRKAGAIILGKTNLSELSGFTSPYSGFSSRGGMTKNPYNFSTTTYGSSSGSAVAMAANLAAISLGTETVGSIIAPSSICNVVGYKPTFGLLPTDGVIPISTALDTIGIITRTVSDNYMVMKALTDPKHPLPMLKLDTLTGLRIGVLREPYFSQKVLSDQLDQLNSSIKKLKQAGATIIDHLKGISPKILAEIVLLGLSVDIDSSMKEYLRKQRQPINQQPMTSLSDIYGFVLDHPELPGSEYNSTMLEFAKDILLENNETLYRQNLIDVKSKVYHFFDEIMRNNSLHGLLVPSEPKTASYMLPDLAGLPIITIPAGEANGHKFGISFFSMRGADDLLFKVAKAIEHEYRELPKFV